MNRIYSMTGYSNLEKKLKKGSVSITISSVNNRFTELNLQISDNIKTLEKKFSDILKSHLKRGKVNCTVIYTDDIEDQFEIDQNTLKQIASAIRLINSEIPNATVNATEILNYPGIKVERKDLEEIMPDLEQCFNEAVLKFLESRALEGDRIRCCLLAIESDIEKQLDVIRDNLESLVATEKERILGKLSDTEIPKERLEAEVVLAAQRADIKEEYDRLRSHLAQTESILHGGGLCGKRLDFLMQEYNREANTIASKASNLLITDTAVELKVLIEQMREQIQNIE
ncbi:MAG: YicC/YloC family endoribonuclease [Succinivibrio sp.]